MMALYSRTSCRWRQVSIFPKTFQQLIKTGTSMRDMDKCTKHGGKHTRLFAARVAMFRLFPTVGCVCVFVVRPSMP